MYDSIVWSIFNRIIDSNVIVLLRIISGYSVLLIIGEGDCFAMDGVNISNCVFDMLGKGCFVGNPTKSHTCNIKSYNYGVKRLYLTAM